MGKRSTTVPPARIPDEQLVDLRDPEDFPGPPRSQEELAAEVAATDKAMSEVPALTNAYVAQQAGVELDQATAAAVNAKPPAESKADKFRRLASIRTTKALKAIAVVGNLSARAQYEYTEEQIDRMIVALRGAVNDVSNRFDAKSKPAQSFFQV